MVADLLEGRGDWPSCRNVATARVSRAKCSQNSPPSASSLSSRTAASAWPETLPTSSHTEHLTPCLRILPKDSRKSLLSLSGIGWDHVGRKAAPIESRWLTSDTTDCTTLAPLPQLGCHLHAPLPMSFSLLSSQTCWRPHPTFPSTLHLPSAS